MRDEPLPNGLPSEPSTSTRSMKIMRRLASLALPAGAATGTQPEGSTFCSAASGTWKSSWKRCSMACSTNVSALTLAATRLTKNAVTTAVLIMVANGSSLQQESFQIYRASAKSANWIGIVLSFTKEGADRHGLPLHHR